MDLGKCFYVHQMKSVNLFLCRDLYCMCFLLLVNVHYLSNKQIWKLDRRCWFQSSADQYFTVFKHH